MNPWIDGDFVRCIRVDGVLASVYDPPDRGDPDSHEPMSTTQETPSPSVRAAPSPRHAPSGQDQAREREQDQGSDPTRPDSRACQRQMNQIGQTTVAYAPIHAHTAHEPAGRHTPPARASGIPAYRAPLWLPGAHAQTIVSALFARLPEVAYRRERWETPDGDFIELDWAVALGHGSASPCGLNAQNALDGPDALSTDALNTLAPGRPDALNPPGASDIPDTLGGLDAPDVPGKPDVQDQPGAPSAPDTPNTPNSPDALATPGRLNALDQPGASGATDPLDAPNSSDAQAAPDGPDTLDQLVASNAPDTPAAPLFVLFHGLEGSSRSHYARALAADALARGWRAVVVHFRSCSGPLNRLPRFYHMADADEIDWILRRLRARHRGPLFAAGVSLGGNALLHWLAQRREDASAIVAAAAAISVPLDVHAGALRLARGFGRVYAYNFLRTLKAKALQKLQQYPGLYDRRALLASRTLRAFDDIVTAPLHGFRDAHDYWTRATLGPKLREIATPTLVLNARNDPFLPARALPTRSEVSASIELEQPAQGGHVGFTSGPFPGRYTWLGQRVFGYFAPFAGAVGPVKADNPVASSAETVAGFSVESVESVDKAGCAVGAGVESAKPADPASSARFDPSAIVPRIRPARHG